MGKLIKKAERGAAANYITRTRAVRKLQLSLADFRRLCILKGIYPREPRNKRKAAGKSRNPNNTFYYVKDINYLLHEPIVQKFREHKVFLKKLARALAKNQVSTAKVLEENEPRYSLDHLVKERYPTFVDALRDLDDCLSHVFLFASLPASEKIEKRMVDDSVRLAAEFLNYVITSRCLRKVFLSIKGIYYQAEIKGQKITWIVPYQFSQEMPEDVDFRVMQTFLEFYQTMLAFVNYKLYSDYNLKYPPRLDAQMDENGAGLIASYVVETADGAEGETCLPAAESNNQASLLINKKQLDNRLKSLPAVLSKLSNAEPVVVEQPLDAEATATVEDEEADESPILAAQTGEPASQQQSLVFDRNLFSQMTVYLSREVPRYALEFVLRAFGATVCWPETAGGVGSSPLREDSDRITHQIVDRPLEHLSLRSDRIYLQPQWVFDSINAGRLLKEELYAPGKTLPPHLSPFVQYEEGDYVPEGVKDNSDDVSIGRGEEVYAQDDDDDEEDVEADYDDNEDMEVDSQYQAELDAEAAGVSYSSFAKDRPQKPNNSGQTASVKRKQQTDKQTAEKLSMAKMVMSNRQRRQVERIERKQASKSAEFKRLSTQKKRLSTSK